MNIFQVKLNLKSSAYFFAHHKKVSGGEDRATNSYSDLFF